MRELSGLGDLAADAIEMDTVAFISWYKDGRLLTASQPFVNLTGFTRDMLELMKWPEDFGTQETVDSIRQAMVAMDRGETAYRHDGELIKQDSSHVPVLMFVHKYNLADGKEPVYYSFIVDLGEQLLARESLDYYEQKTRQYLDFSFNPVWVNIGNKIAYANQRCADLLGAKNPGELLGMSIYDVIHHDYHEVVKRRIELMMAEDLGLPVIDEKLVRLDNKVIIVEVSALKIIFERKPAILVMLHDITERRHVEESVRESRALLEMVIDNVPQRIFWKDRNSVYIGCNRHFTIAAGVSTPDQIAGKTDYDLAWTREQADSFRRDDREVMDNDRPKYHIIEPQLQADGSLSWLDTNKVPLHDEQGNVIGILGTYEDITERQQTEEALRQSEEKLKLAVDGSRMGLWDWDLVTGTLTWSDRCKEIFDINSGTTMSYQIFLEALHPDDRGRIDLDVRYALDHKTDYDTDMRILWHDGTIHWAAAKGRGYYNAAGQPVRMSGMVIDITDRKYVEMILKKREADLLFSQRIAHIGSWRWDENTGKYEWSDEFYRILGLEPGQVRPDQALFISLVHPDDRDMVIRDAKQAQAENRSSSLDCRIIRPDGTLRYVHIEAVRLVKDKYGRTVGTFGTMQDITERKQVELSLEDAKVQAEMYLDLMGHDINNMDQIAMGFLEMALETLGPDNPARDYVAKPLEALKNSTSLIQRVKKLQQTREGDLPVHELNVGQVLREVLPMFSDLPGRRVTIYTAIDCECMVKANDLLRDVFENLIGNSIKHSTGQLIINVAAESITVDSRDYCRISIEDNGPGIPDQLKKSIFERFRTGAKKASGRGLGLYLVNSLVELYQGKVWVEDRVPGDYSQGVKFVVLLPVD